MHISKSLFMTCMAAEQWHARPQLRAGSWAGASAGWAVGACLVQHSLSWGGGGGGKVQLPGS